MTAAPIEQAVSLTPGLRGSLRRSRTWLVVSALALLIAIAALLITGSAAQQGQQLGATNAAPVGAQAVLRVLGEHGVSVHPVATLVDAQAVAADPEGTTVAIFDPNGVLSDARRAKAAALGHHLVLISPTHAVRDGLPQAETLDAAELENQHVAEGTNAANAIRLLGRDATLIWYLPSIADVAPGGAVSLADAVPGWVTPLVLLSAFVALAAAIWQGRRFGRLVYEDLPVIVPAHETLEGRARLYRRSQARLHALDQLRVGALGRLAALLGLPRSARVDEIASAAASVTGRADGEVLGILRDDLPDTDAALVAGAEALAALERAVRVALTR